MKVLIISLPITGSTSLMKRIAEKDNLRTVFEPFGETNPYKPNLNYDILDNIVVKTMIFDVINQSDNNILFYKEFSKKFDKVILLSRRNLKECAESLAYMEKYVGNGYALDRPYIWNETGLNVGGKYKFLQKQNQDLETLSSDLNIPITYYEDIFDMNSNERYRKNIKIDKSKLI